jgi:hypothetical protein
VGVGVGVCVGVGVWGWGWGWGWVGVGVGVCVGGGGVGACMARGGRESGAVSVASAQVDQEEGAHGRLVAGWRTTQPQTQTIVDGGKPTSHTQHIVQRGQAGAVQAAGTML